MPLSKSVLAALAAAFIAAPTFAEEAHHPEATPQTPPSAAHGAKTAPAGGAMGGMGMMSMRHDGMDGGMHVLAPLFGMHPTESVEHLEGRLAFLKAEIGITAAQEVAWAAFADAIRDAAKRSAEQPGMMAAMRAGSAPERLKALEANLRTRLETIQASSAALDQLYRQIGAEQQATLDALLSPMARGMAGR